MAAVNAIKACRRRIPLEIRFWAKVDKSAGPNGCWPWTGAKCGQHKSHRRPGRYGFIRRGGADGKTVLATHVSWEFEYHEPVPEGMQVLHHCDNSECVNPAHIFLGDTLDNVADLREKNLHIFGELSPWAKLCSDDIYEIRRLYTTGLLQREIGDQFGLTQAYVSKIILHQTWKHLS